MAEKGNLKSLPGKGQLSARRRTQVAVPHARVTQEVTTPARDPGSGQRAPPTPAAPSGAIPATTQDSPGPSRARPGHPEGDTRHRVRVARLSEAGLRQLGGISSHQRILEWLESTDSSGAQDMAQLQEQLQDELEEIWEAEKHGNDPAGKGL